MIEKWILVVDKTQHQTAVSQPDRLDLTTALQASSNGCKQCAIPIYFTKGNTDEVAGWRMKEVNECIRSTRRKNRMSISLYIQTFKRSVGVNCSQDGIHKPYIGGCPSKLKPDERRIGCKGKWDLLNFSVRSRQRAVQQAASVQRENADEAGLRKCDELRH